MNYQPRNVLVTGGAGFIGSNFINYFLRAHEAAIVVNLDKLTYASTHRHHECERYVFIQGDINDAALVDTILRQYQIDTIVHFAAESHVDRSILNPAVFIMTNVVGTSILLEAARRYWLDEKKLTQKNCRFHHVSTDEVYGSLALEEPAFDETSSYGPNSPYAATKAGSDHLVRAYYKTYQLPVTMSHSSNNYGPYQHVEKFIPTIISACLMKKPIPIYGNGTNIRDWLYVEDHCRGIDKILKFGEVGETYHLGGENEMNNIEVASRICDLMNTLYPQTQSYNELITFVNDRQGHDWRYAININKIRNKLNWTPTEKFDNGLRKTIQFYKEMFQEKHVGHSEIGI